MKKKVLISFFSIILFLSALNIGIAAKDTYANSEDLFTADTTADFEAEKLKDIDNEHLTKEETKEVKETFNEYGLEPLDLKKEDLPANTEVLNFDSVEEFKKFMDETQEPIKVDVDEDETPTGTTAFVNFLTSNNKASAATKTYKSTANAGFSTINLYAKVDRNKSGKVTSTHVYTTHTGVTLGIAWNQSYAYAKLNSTKKGGKAYGGGTCSRVIFLQGIGTITSRNVSLSVKF
ncbi:hypothetical protein [Priestia megaterium]|uniref:hypothetical protein n=1 Tax=Priestia megaterium TaxID=1404 RepID=UPI0025A364F8|nr:hypothetical protein [Priestia megaterium]MDM8149410.1 hypothetical protein [Priestia megaterium]